MQYTLEDFRQNWSLHPNGKRFSSFAYRVEAVRILGMVPGLSQSTEVDSEPQAETIDACLAGWFLHLPASKRDPMLSNGRVDEMLFQGQILSTCTQPRHNNVCMYMYISSELIATEEQSTSTAPGPSCASHPSTP